MTQDLPARPNLGWLKRNAKDRLAELRARDPNCKLYSAQLLVARDYGFKSWRELKARVDELAGSRHDDAALFEAARIGDIEAIRRAIASGFDPARPDTDGRTIFQIAKEHGHAGIEILVRNLREGETRPDADARAVRAILSAAQLGEVSELSDLLDARPDFIDAMGGRLKKATALHLAVLRNQHAVVRLLIERGADVDTRDFPENATPLHFAALHGDLETVGLLIEAEADVEGKGDDYGLGVLGWPRVSRGSEGTLPIICSAKGPRSGPPSHLIEQTICWRRLPDSGTF